MLQFLLSAWRAGLRGRAVQMILLLGAALIGVAYLAAGFSPRQPKTVTLDVGLSVLRILMVLLATNWVQELVAKEIERKTALFSLAYPVDRSGYLAGRFLGIAALLLLANVLFGLLLWLAVLLAGESSYEQAQRLLLGAPFWMTVGAIWVDVMVITAFTLLVAVVSTTPMLPLAMGIAFAVASRSLGAVIEYLHSGADGDRQLQATYLPIVDVLQRVLPDLSRLDWRSWPMYGNAPSVGAMGWSVVMAIGYVLAMLGLAVLSFRKRECS